MYTRNYNYLMCLERRNKTDRSEAKKEMIGDIGKEWALEWTFVFFFKFYFPYYLQVDVPLEK